MDSFPPTAASQPEPGPNGRLDSWKAIASHLKRSVRTVQQWEKDEALPVHRQRHRRGGSVYAHTSEIDAWWANRRAPPEDAVEADPPDDGPWTWRRMAWLGSALTAVAVLVTASAVLSIHNRAEGPAPVAHEVVIAAAETPPQDRSLSHLVSAAVEDGLSESPSVRPVPRARLEDLLRYATRPPDSALDPALARELALRGGIPAYVTSRVEPVGNGYIVSMSLVNPTTGLTMASASSGPLEGGLVARAARRLIENHARAWTEKLQSAVPPERLQDVTTSSLTAARLYSIAIEQGYRNEWKAAEQLIRQALDEDASFASGWMCLAWTTYNQGKPGKEYLPHAERARHLAEDRAAPWEREFIAGGYYWMTGEFGRSSAAYQAVLSLKHDDPWTLNNLGFLESWAGRADLAIRHLVRQADVRPNDVHTNVLAAQALSIWGRDPGAAASYLARAERLTPRDNDSELPYWAVWTRSFPVWQHWLQRDLQAASRETDRLLDTHRSAGSAARDEFLLYAGLFRLSLGQLKAAEDAFGLLSEAEGRHHYLALVALAREQPRTVRAELASDWHSFGVWRSINEVLLPRAGLFREGRQLIARLKARRIPPPFLNAAEGELLAQEGHLRDAIAPLEQSVTQVRHTGTPIFFLASESLARVWEREGDPGRAIRVLEDAARQKARTYPTTGPSGMFWIRVEARLAELYRGAGREKEAAAVERELADLLAWADDDHPVRRMLKARAMPTIDP